MMGFDIFKSLYFWEEFIDPDREDKQAPFLAKTFTTKFSEVPNWTFDEI